MTPTAATVGISAKKKKSKENIERKQLNQLTALLSSQYVLSPKICLKAQRIISKSIRAFLSPDATHLDTQSTRATVAVIKVIVSMDEPSLLPHGNLLELVCTLFRLLVEPLYQPLHAEIIDTVHHIMIHVQNIVLPLPNSLQSSSMEKGGQAGCSSGGIEGCHARTTSAGVLLSSMDPQLVLRHLVEGMVALLEDLDDIYSIVAHDSSISESISSTGEQHPHQQQVLQLWEKEQVFVSCLEAYCIHVTCQKHCDKGEEERALLHSKKKSRHASSSVSAPCVCSFPCCFPSTNSEGSSPTTSTDCHCQGCPNTAPSAGDGAAHNSDTHAGKTERQSIVLNIGSWSRLRCLQLCVATLLDRLVSYTQVSQFVLDLKDRLLRVCMQQIRQRGQPFAIKQVRVSPSARTPCLGLLAITVTLLIAYSLTFAFICMLLIRARL